jgi:hypothetical protein
MIVGILLFTAYVFGSVIAIRALFRTCVKVKNINLRLLAKSASLALFLTPTISVPAAIPMPAFFQLLVGVAALHPELALVGLLPIAVVTLGSFLLMKVTRSLKSLVYGESST